MSKKKDNFYVWMALVGVGIVLLSLSAYFGSQYVFTGIGTRTTYGSMVCTETDTGEQYNIKGTTSSNNKTYDDFCISGGVLREFYCTALGELASVELNCDCAEGRCTDIEEGIPTNITDAGVTVKGCVEPLANQDQKYCKDGGFLYTCNENVWTFLSNCSTKLCKNNNVISGDAASACGTIACTDDDATDSVIYAGKTIVTTNMVAVEYLDSCSGTTLTQYSCAADNRVNSNTTDCLNINATSICLSGACRQKGYCNVALDCNDNNTCTNETCTNNTCSYAKICECEKDADCPAVTCGVNQCKSNKCAAIIDTKCQFWADYQYYIIGGIILIIGVIVYFLMKSPLMKKRRK